MNSKKKNLLLFLAIFSLVAIASIIIFGLLRNKKGGSTSETLNNVLGELAQSDTQPSPTSYVNSMVQNTLNNTQNFLQNSKETMSEKILEVEKTILKSVQNEINTLTQNQIKTLQTQICVDWGVISPFPSPSPS